jgi:UDP-N-acetylmuramate--alanine ligase
MTGKKIHMIGIGGIGMSALAQLYVAEGMRVSGSDRETSPTTELLEKKGVTVAMGQKADNVPVDADLVVYSDAVWPDNAERVRAAELGIKQISYFEALGEVAKGKRVLAVTGTHGKTTTTAMLAKILKDCGKSPTAVIGTIVPEFGSNYLAGDSDIFVVEACEYRNHFLVFDPEVLVITNLEWDHTDFFTTFDEMKEAFDQARGKAKTVVDSEVYKKESVPELQLVGEFNKMNARAAKAGAKVLFPDLADADIDRSLAAFKGTWRRFEKKGTTPEGALVYDDYAHHPTAIRETLAAARAKFPDKKITIVFHPHLYSRTRDLFPGFVQELAKADRVIMVPIYPAREEPIPGVTSDALIEAIKKTNPNAIALRTFDEIEKELRSSTSSADLIITMGAGDVYKVADALVGTK